MLMKFRFNWIRLNEDWNKIRYTFEAEVNEQLYITNFFHDASVIRFNNSAVDGAIDN